MFTKSTIGQMTHLLVIATILALSIKLADAALILQESFDIGASGYTDATNLGGQGPTNPPFTGTWSSTSHMQTLTGGLSYLTLNGSGGYIRNNLGLEGGADRSVSTGTLVGNRLVITGLMRRDSDDVPDGTEAGEPFSEIRLNFSSGKFINIFDYHNASFGISVQINGANFGSGNLSTLGAVNYISVILDDEAGLSGNDLINMYVNPSDISSLIGIASTAAFTVTANNQEVYDSGVSEITQLLVNASQINGAGVGMHSFDEISVLTIPEPSTATLFALGAAGLLFRPQWRK